jgi:hypothetical protein
MRTETRKKSKNILVALTLVSLAVLITPARKAVADSVLGIGHFGIPIMPADARSRALGGASVALPGEDFSFTNPARTVNFRRSGVNCVVAQDYRTLEGPSSSDKLRSTEFLAFRGVFPAIKRFVVSWGVYQTRDLEWQVEDRVSLPFLNGELQRNFSSSGGLYVSRIGIARAIIPHLAVGLGFDWILGKINQRRDQDFGTDGYITGSELFSYKYSCFRPTFSLLAGYKRFSLGLAVTVPKTSKVTERSAFSNGYIAQELIDMDFPLLWRAGTAFSVTKRSLIAADIEYEEWSNQTFTSDPSITNTDQWRFCLGYEILPSTGEERPFYRKIPLRMGYSRTTYPFKIDGEPVNEQFFSFGTGIYFGKGNGALDIACEVGKRRAVATGIPEESVVRLVFSLSAFDLWVPRPRRK